MNASHTYYTKFVFTLKAILPDLEDDVRVAQLDLARRGTDVDSLLIVAAWVVHQLERYLYLTLEMSDSRVQLMDLSDQLGDRFLRSNPDARDLLFQQITPALTVGESIPYTDRICRVIFHHLDMTLYFL